MGTCVFLFLIQWPWAEKTSKNWQNHCIFKKVIFLAYLGHFLSPRSPDQKRKIFLYSASYDTSLEYPHDILLRLLFLPPKRWSSFLRPFPNTKLEGKNIFPSTQTHWNSLELYSKSNFHVLWHALAHMLASYINYHIQDRLGWHMCLCAPLHCFDVKIKKPEGYFNLTSKWHHHMCHHRRHHCMHHHNCLEDVVVHATAL